MKPPAIDTTVIFQGKECHRRVAWPAVAIVVFSTTLLFPGCTLPQRTFQPALDPAAFGDDVFLHYLATVPVVTVEEGVRAVLLLDKDGGSEWPTYEQRYEELRRRGAIKFAWRLTPGRILDKGTLAHMLRTLCDLPLSLGELLASKTGLGDRRYALRTCIHEGILTGGLARDPVTGGELLSALTNAEARLAAHAPSEP